VGSSPGAHGFFVATRAMGMRGVHGSFFRCRRSLSYCVKSLERRMDYSRKELLKREEISYVHYVMLPVSGPRKDQRPT